MTENQETSKPSSAPVALVLFVGFIFGVIVGFMAKDPLVKQMTMMKNTNIPANPAAITAQPTTSAVGETAPSDAVTTEAAPIEEDKKADEENTSEEEKKAEEEVPAAEAAPAA